jgi:hypothetical protein
MALRKWQRSARINRRVTQVIELIHVIEPGMALPTVLAEMLLDYGGSSGRYAPGAEFFFANLHLCGDIGAYVDTPIIDTAMELIGFAET